MADDASSIDTLNATAQTQLRTVIERIERLEEDKAKRLEEEALIDLYLSAIGGL